MSSELLAACINAAGAVVAGRVAPLAAPQGIDDAIAHIARQVYAKVSQPSPVPAVMAACVHSAAAAVAARVAPVHDPSRIDDAIAAIARATYQKLGQ